MTKLVYICLTSHQVTNDNFCKISPCEFWQVQFFKRRTLIKKDNFSVSTMNDLTVMRKDNNGSLIKVKTWYSEYESKQASDLSDKKNESCESWFTPLSSNCLVVNFE